MRLYARKEYGHSQRQYQFFDSKGTNAFKRLILRNGANDWGQSLFRDAAIQSLVQHLPLETQHAQPAIVFINGEYWGLHILRDRLDKFHFETSYGIPREHVAILERDARLVDGTEADVASYSAFLNDLTNGKLREPEAIDRHIALPELLDYTVLQAYAGNTDWPSNNISYYRYTGPQFGQEKGDWSRHPLTTGHASDFAAISCWTLNFRAGEPIWLRERRSEATIRSSVNNGLTPSPRPLIPIQHQRNPLD